MLTNFILGLINPRDLILYYTDLLIPNASEDLEDMSKCTYVKDLEFNGLSEKTTVVGL